MASRSDPVEIVSHDGDEITAMLGRADKVLGAVIVGYQAVVSKLRPIVQSRCSLTYAVSAAVELLARPSPSPRGSHTCVEVG
jgi:hypothetical protein